MGGIIDSKKLQGVVNTKNKSEEIEGKYVFFTFYYTIFIFYTTKYFFNCKKYISIIIIFINCILKIYIKYIFNLN